MTQRQGRRQALSEEEKAEARRIFAAGGDDSRICSFCGGFHLRACPRVSELEWHDSGGANPGHMKRVAFWPEGSWDDSYVIWPDELADVEEPDE